MKTAFQDISGLSAADRADWAELASHQPESGAFADEAWVASWIEAYRPAAPLLLCGSEGGRLVGMAIVQSLTERWAGCKISVLQSLTNVESFRFDFLSMAGIPHVELELWRTLYGDGRWDVVRLDHVPEQSPTMKAAFEAATERGWIAVAEPTFDSPWRALGSPPGPWDRGLSRKFKSNLRNRERRLEALGGVTFEVIGGGGGQDEALKSFYALEDSGWKAERGTSIMQRESVKTFYDRLVDRASTQIWIPILRVQNRPAAAQLLRVQGHTMFMLKTAYHRDFAPYAPGQLLTARLIRYGLERGMEALDFLADDMRWKSDWAPQLRRHCRLLVFSPGVRGRYAYWTRYGFREQAKRLSVVRRILGWSKGAGKTD